MTACRYPDCDRHDCRWPDCQRTARVGEFVHSCGQPIYLTLTRPRHADAVSVDSLLAAWQRFRGVRHG